MERIQRKNKVRDFHQAKWNEPIIFELHQKGERGVDIPLSDQAVAAEVGNGVSAIPEGMLRKEKPNLPEIGQARVLRHYVRLSQETLGSDFNVEIGQGTCTMKYIPKINELLVRNPKIMELHPLQDESTVQGMLEIIYNLDVCMREISGMDHFSFQPSGGTQALFAMASIARKYHESRGEAEQRNEIITTIFSHPSQAATAAVKGFKVITLHPDEEGFPDIEKLKAAVSERTAGFVVANPEDTGIYNPRIKEFTDIVHQAGGLCYYDQANANGLLGITRAREAGFDMCFFNLHKTFAAPHMCGGPATGALGVVEELKEFLPAPIVEFDGEKYYLNEDLPQSIGKVRAFHGVAQTVLRSYAWIRALGPDGLKEVAQTAVLNNNYLYSKIQKIRGASAPYVKGQRLEQVRYSWEQMAQETGVTTEDVQRRMTDFGLHYWTSHHPYIVPQPFTLEPTESYSKADLDEYIAALEQISEEAYENPEIVQDAPYNSTIHKLDEQDFLDHPEKWCITWRAYQKKTKQPERI
ncbi:aminomethyl-transferring glycine dehydrogenase subunit GcvPB [Bacillus badius]|uniref:glycine dehydrogenase (aminomethyl-transferring) n=1 Tax=Bacillus badius TaxID=1455 RepID=A0ABR5AW40_BACBA|nr:aminomethyl-transferring glycine dehydrogenase subunit GcvPB [Bacillus badius]KIL74394.1 Glycine dehydrogenase [Bacillus badius]KIL78864.1 Glycine dehydrogenase [Bacillus badius]KZR58934.1 glycine dehydrogenase [Bacillus badius]MED4717386.1 aminomethyl-transferring glycine dehydrogenase subunit GcvPB [Bacillus badius]